MTEIDKMIEETKKQIKEHQLHLDYLHLVLGVLEDRRKTLHKPLFDKDGKMSI